MFTGPGVIARANFPHASSFRRKVHIYFEIGALYRKLTRRLRVASKPPAPRTRGRAARMVGNRLMVGQRTLTPSILVRVQVPQPSAFADFAVGKIRLRRDWVQPNQRRSV